MNILAHIYLSGENDEIKIGNFIGDFVKGHEYLNYPIEIQKGILLHRKIDYFTDNHPIVRESKHRLNPIYHKFSGILIDIFYDHFLVNQWNLYSNKSHKDFLSNLYVLLTENDHHLPKQLVDYTNRFVKNDWLSYYSNIEGVRFILKNMAIHTSLPKEVVNSCDLVKENYEIFKNEFNEFFPQLMNYVILNHNINLGIHKI